MSPRGSSSRSCSRPQESKAQLEPAVEHHESALEDAPLKVLVSEADVEDARDAIEALMEPEEESET